VIEALTRPPRIWNGMMEREHVLKDIPEDEIKKVIADFQSEGAAVAFVRQTDGRWTVRASFAKPKVGGTQG
jgi:hypothetical protein